MTLNFTIVTAVTKEYLSLLYWGIGTWAYKPQLKDRPIIVYYDGIKEKDLAFVSKAFSDVRLIKWDTVGYLSKSEAMFSAFVFGAVRDVKTPYYMKMDADAYCTNDKDIWSEQDFDNDIIGHKWGYTKPAAFISRLDNFYNSTNVEISKDRIMKHARFESYCCLHKTAWVKNIADKFSGKLPVPSHDTTLWYYANKEGRWAGKDIKKAGVDNARNWKAMREISCSGLLAFNPVMNEELLSHIQLEITSRCNIGCNQCDRNCGVVPAGRDMSPVQIWKFLDESIAAGKKWKRIDVIGGEPTLHPRLVEILDLLKTYKEYSPKTKVRLSTNGLGNKVLEALKSVPDWVHIRNSAKQGKEQPHDAYRIAPIDKGIKEIKSCSVPWRCGVSLTNNGYFPCGAGASLARVFGIDIGAMTLNEFTPSIIKKQLSQLCWYCGHSNSMKHEICVDNKASDSWVEAIKKYDPTRMATY